MEKEMQKGEKKETGGDGAPHIIVKLDRERRFRLDMLAIADFQSLTGIRLSDFNNLDDYIDKDAGVLIALLWAGLRHEDKALTYEYIGRFLTMDNVDSLQAMLSEHISTAVIGEPEKNSQRAKPKETTVRKRSPGRGASSKKTASA